MMLLLAAALASSEPSSLSPGWYRAELTYVVETAIPVLGKQVSSTSSTIVGELKQSAEGATFVYKTCSLETLGSGFTTRAPASTIRGIPQRTAGVVLDGNAVTIDLGQAPLGYRPQNGMALPANGKDPQVVDTDGDGVPGARLDLDLGLLGTHALNIVSTGNSRLVGTVVNGGAAGKIIVSRSLSRVLSGLPGGAQEDDGRNQRVVADKTVFVLSTSTATSCPTPK
jgi:hypothetical protein